MKLLLAFFLLASAPAFAAETTPPVPLASKTYSVQLAYSEWAVVVSSLRSSDTISAKAANDLMGKIAGQVAAEQRQEQGAKK